MLTVGEGRDLTSSSSGSTADLTDFPTTVGQAGSILLRERCRDGVHSNVLISGWGGKGGWIEPEGGQETMGKRLQAAIKQPWP